MNSICTLTSLSRFRRCRISMSRGDTQVCLCPNASQTTAHRRGRRPMMSITFVPSRTRNRKTQSDFKFLFICRFSSQTLHSDSTLPGLCCQTAKTAESQLVKSLDQLSADRHNPSTVNTKGTEKLVNGKRINLLRR